MSLFASATHIWVTCLRTGRSRRASDSASTALLWHLKPEETTNLRLQRTTEGSLQTFRTSWGGNRRSRIHAFVLLSLRIYKSLHKGWSPVGTDFLRFTEVKISVDLQSSRKVDTSLRTTQTPDVRGQLRCWRRIWINLSCLNQTCKVFVACNCCFFVMEWS